MNRTMYFVGPADSLARVCMPGHAVADLAQFVEVATFYAVNAVAFNLLTYSESTS